ncbi:MAG: serine O-acetyltransferase EpsC, partial [Pseudomonadota bacterium]
QTVTSVLKQHVTQPTCAPTNNSQMTALSVDQLWHDIREFADQEVRKGGALRRLFEQSVMQHVSLTDALAWILAHKLNHDALPFDAVFNDAQRVFSKKDTRHSILLDLQAIVDRDSACQPAANAFLFYKGFHALQTHRLAHHHWKNGNKAMAFALQSKSSSTFDVDIHPASIIGDGIMFDHATGIVIGETARIDNNVSIMQSVTLGGTGKQHDDRHPKISSGVLISCNASILGNIRLGKNAKVAAGSVVLKDVAQQTTVAGVPAKSIGAHSSNTPARVMDHYINCDDVNIALKKRTGKSSA